MLADFTHRLLCAFRDEAAHPYILIGLLAFGAIGVAVGHARGFQPSSRKFIGLIGMTLGVILGAVLASLLHDVCGPWRE